MLSEQKKWGCSGSYCFIMSMWHILLIRKLNAIFRAHNALSAMIWTVWPHFLFCRRKWEMHMLIYFYMLSMCAYSLSHKFMSGHTDGLFFLFGFVLQFFFQRCTLTNPQRDTALAPPRLKLRLSRSKTTVISVSASPSLSLSLFFHFEAVKKERLKVLVLPVNHHHHHHHHHHLFGVLNQAQWHGCSSVVKVKVVLETLT